MDYEETKEQLNQTLGDSDDVTFTTEEKDRALQKAWNDSFVSKVVVDSTLTFSSASYSYARPPALDSIKEVMVSASNNPSTDEPVAISPNLWEEIDGTLKFKNGAHAYIPSGYTLYLKGIKKLDYEADTLDTTDLQEYVIALAGFNTLTMLGYKKANLFLKNDTSMSELINLRRELEREVTRLRGALPRKFESF